MALKASTVIFVFLIIGQISAETVAAQDYQDKRTNNFVQIMEDSSETSASYEVVAAEGETTTTEEECGCVDEENCLETVEVAIQCIDGECTATLLQDTDIDFDADLALTAIPVEDNTACCA